MTEPDFDVIVVGAGVAGLVAAHELSRAGHAVAVLERGESVGSKNLSGGILYCRVMTDVFPDFLTTAPVERRIDSNELCFLTPDAWVGLDYSDARLYQDGTAVTVLRARLDAWLAEQCEAKGATVMPGVRVDRLLRESDRFVGVQAGEDQLVARVVVAADGVNSFLAREAGLRPKPGLHQQALGLKAVIRLDAGTIEERFGVTGDHGRAIALVGDCTQGVAGGGFIYTNRDCVSVGLVLRLDDLVARGVASTDVFDHFLAHPFVDRYIRGGELLEYGSHLVNEGGLAMLGTIAADGLVVVGDAAGLTINTGLTVRGMDLAAGSGLAAARAIHEGLEAGDTSRAALAAYPRFLDAGFVGHDLRTFAKAPAFLENPALYTDFAALGADILHQVFGLDGTPRRHLLASAREVQKASPVTLLDLVKAGRRAVQAL